MINLSQRLKKIERLIIETIQENEGLSQREIASLLEVSQATVNRHARQLANMGLLKLERRGMMVRCYLAENGSQGGSNTP